MHSLGAEADTSQQRVVLLCSQYLGCRQLLQTSLEPAVLLRPHHRTHNTWT